VQTPGLFDDARSLDRSDPAAPLADRMRPRAIDEFVGQTHLLGEGRLLYRLVEEGRLTSMIFWGPPGTGKTTLARIIAAHTTSNFVPFSAVNSGIKEIRQVMSDAARLRRHLGKRTVLFIDEIHRFNKAQQDAFLPYVEDGTIILIGATTENPSFEINSALLSRVKVLVLEPLTEDEIATILSTALTDEERGLGKSGVRVSDDLIKELAGLSGGDARVALNTLELAVTSAKTGELTRDDLREALQRATAIYDKSGEQHYNLISAFIKSIRNSDVDATLYWLARMIEGGEDPMYIARRIVHHASEDIGLADPQALVVATSAAHATHLIGLPEARLALAEAAAYLAKAPKSNKVMLAYEAAASDAKRTQGEPVPLHLRNAPTRLMKALGYGRGYQYAHDFDENRAADMECLPERLKGKKYFPE
jgi:putative ATPase